VLKSPHGSDLCLKPVELPLAENARSLIKHLDRKPLI